jgi:hypothetical protein
MHLIRSSSSNPWYYEVCCELRAAEMPLYCLNRHHFDCYRFTSVCNSFRPSWVTFRCEPWYLNSFVNRFGQKNVDPPLPSRCPFYVNLLRPLMSTLMCTNDQDWLMRSFENFLQLGENLHESKRAHTTWIILIQVVDVNEPDFWIHGFSRALPHFYTVAFALYLDHPVEFPLWNTNHMH